MTKPNNIFSQPNVLSTQQATLLEKMLLTDQQLTVSKRVHAKERGRKSPNKMNSMDVPVTMMNYTIRL